MIPLEQIQIAQQRLAGRVIRTPLLRYRGDAPATVYLKLENLQPIGSFKLRGALNAILQLQPSELRKGVVTASAGNMGQGVAWAARELEIECTVVVPEGAAETKLAAIERLRGRVVEVPYERWWQAIEESSFDEVDGIFVHPVQDEQVMAGNGTIGLEILEDLPSADAVLIPFGGGGLSVGIASAIKALRPEAGVFAVEPATGAPLRESFADGEARKVDYQASFVDGSGSPALLPKMWELARGVLDGATAVSIDETAAAVRLLAERSRVVAEGAGALALAAALAEKGGSGNVVCVVSGGNIDSAKLATILAGGTP
ncbi:MAG: pyridoxal-phosphate dependent enzyme [Actinobacteria bacterium]|nr:MAG: pyridoxal-phosphate dependent enzyme [Actinomycetota bacterium]TMM28912.1 MAG: pyridoxal-phosphate dependent enzyme [Actinomycetota bacterium]